MLRTLENLIAMVVLEIPLEDPPASQAEAPAAPAADKTPDESSNEEPKNEETVKMSDLRAVRKESAAYRTKLRALEAEKEEWVAARNKEIEDAEVAKLEGTERLAKEKEILQTQLDAATRSNADQMARNDRMAKEGAIRDAASRFDFHNPGDAAKMINMNNIGIDDGTVDSAAVEEAVQSLAKSQSYLVKGLSDESFGGPTNPKPPENQIPAPKVRLSDEARIASMRKEARELQARGDGRKSLEILNKITDMEFASRGT